MERRDQRFSGSQQRPQQAASLRHPFRAPSTPHGWTSLETFNRILHMALHSHDATMHGRRWRDGAAEEEQRQQRERHPLRVVVARRRWMHGKINYGYLEEEE